MGYDIRLATKMYIRGDKVVTQRIYRLISEPTIPTPLKAKRLPKQAETELIDNGRAAEFKQGRLL